MSEIVLILLLLLLALAALLAGPIALVIVLVRGSRQKHQPGGASPDLLRRVAELEARLRALEAARVQPADYSTPAAEHVAEPHVAAVVEPTAPLPATALPQLVGAAARTATDTVKAVVADPRWDDAARAGTVVESFIGRRALGWTAVVVLLFASAFLIRYAFENHWVGPIGRVCTGLIAGVGATAIGRRLARPGLQLFSRMFTAAGIALLYLSVYSAFGFYHLISQREAGLFLFLVVVESALLALRYDAWSIALMAVVGGLLTPMLMQSEADQYQSLFGYLAMINLGAIIMLLRRQWRAIGIIALLGTQAIYWGWYSGNYHPEKLWWALGFQGAIWLLYLLHTWLVGFVRRRAVDWEDAARTILAAVLAFAAAMQLLDRDYEQWMGTLAVAFALVYALTARVALSAGQAAPLLAASIALASGLIAAAIGLEANAHWVALGWGVEAAVLWWFGARLRALPLRVMALAFAALAVLRVAADVPNATTTLDALPVFNGITLPALATAAVLIAGLASTRRRLATITPAERILAAIGLVACLMMILVVESYDLYRYFDIRHATDRLSLMSLSTWWASYAAVLLAVGFVVRQPLLRWTSLGIFALTVAKVFLVDLSELDEIYRIVAFFVLAMLLGLAAWIYQRFQPEKTTALAASKEM